MTVFLYVLGTYLLVGLLLLAIGLVKGHREGFRPHLDEAVCIVVAYPIIAWLIYRDFKAGKLTWK